MNKPPPCDHEVFTKGEPIATIHARSPAAEEWVQAVAKESGQRVDWHYSSGIASVLFIGDRAAVNAAIDRLAPALDGRIVCRYDDGDASPCRRAVNDDTLPLRTLAVDATWRPSPAPVESST